MTSTELQPIPNGHFKKIAWTKFKPLPCMVILADERDAYGGLKKVLFAGICIWTVAPTNTALIKGAMKLAALKTLSEAEATVVEGVRPRSAFADAHARYNVLGGQFIEEIYYVMGGALGLANAPSVKDFKEAIREEAVRLEYALSVVRIYHHHAVHHFGQPRSRKASLNIAASLIHKLKIVHGDHKTPPQARYVKEAWAQYRDSIALLYAASTIQTANGKSLLAKIMAAENNLENDKHLIDDWLSRAKFVVDYVLAKCVEVETADDNDFVIPSAVSRSLMPAPAFSEEQKTVIRIAFNRSAV